MSLDYSGRNLRGKSFKEQDLTNADFSHADIRGANFTGAILRGANFSGTKAGLQKYQVIFLVFVSFLLASVSGLLSFSNVHFTSSYNTGLDNQLIGWVSIIIFFVAAVRRGIQFAFGVVAVVGAVGAALTHTVAAAIAGKVAGVVAATVAIAVAVAFALAVTGSVAFALAITGVVAFALTISAAFALAEVFIGAYIGWRAITGDEKYAIIRNLAIAFAAFGGTSFRNADLTDANFISATLKNTDFRNATLTRTCLRKVKKLDYVRPGNTYLKYPQLRQVLVTGNGRQKNFDRQDLRGINLQGADLVDVSLIGADLSKANLQDSDLSRAKLVQTQLDATDFTGATLTGAYIEDWNITTDTNFRGIRCEYVYMRLPTDDNPEPWRKPDNREEVFGDGEFGDFIKPIVDTLDLYHNQGVDPRAIAISFKELAENNPDADLELVAMEKRGADKFLIRAKVAPEADKSELNQQYFETYNYLKTLSPAEQKQHYLNQLSEKDKEIELQQKQLANFENMVGTALGHPHSTATDIKTILVLAANPKTTSHLRLDEEVREIDAGLQRAKKREKFDLQQRWAVGVRDISQALLDFKPHIVHFCGHGGGDDGLAFEDQTGKLQYVSTAALAGLFELFSPQFNQKVECVILNACYSEVQATAISQHIPYVIGMTQAIGDRAAIEFAVGFYSALGAGESIDFAYKLGCNAIAIAGISENLTPVIHPK